MNSENEKTKNSGFDDYTSKPIDHDELFNKKKLNRNN